MNTIEKLKKFEGKKNVAQGFTYAFLFCLDVADDYIFEAIQDVKKMGLYKHELKRLCNTAYGYCHKTSQLIRCYLKEEDEKVFEIRDDYLEQFKKEIFVFYNTLLKDSSERFFTNYEHAKICAKLDIANLILSYWQKMDRNLTKQFPKPYDISTNDYDVFLDRCMNSINMLIKHSVISPDKDNTAPLTKEEEARFQGAFACFRDSIVKVFTDMTG